MPGASRRIEAERVWHRLGGVLLATLIVSLVGSASRAQASSWYVRGSITQPGDGTSWLTAFKSIQQGIDAAADGDRVIVAEGTYLENVNVKGKNITVTSTDPLDPTVVSATAIDGKRSGPAVTFSGTEGDGCVLSGFTIRNGYATYGGGICGGARDNPTRATIEHNRITVNQADHGAGLAFCNGTIRNNVIFRNSAKGYGGGIWGCGDLIENNTITGNSAANGGAVYSCYGTIRNCILWGNHAARDISYSSLPTYSCIESWTEGGEGNMSNYPYFSGVSNSDYHLLSWSPCIDAGDATSTFSREPQPNGGRINMGAYGNTPQAASASGDSDHDSLPDGWEVLSFSDLSQGPSGDPDGDATSNLQEYYRGSNPTAPPAVWHVDGAIPVSGNGTSWETAFRMIQTGINASSDGDTVLVAEGRYLENIAFQGKSITLRSLNPEARNVVAQTIIDGKYAGPVVTFLGKEDATCVLSGFTIRNGSAPNGGGICGGESDSPTHTTICNNVITGNQALEEWPHGHGGGVAYCGGLIWKNTISCNSARQAGGIFNCSGTIRNNLIVGNSAEVNGGGLLLCQGTIENNTVVRNWAEFGGGLSNCNGVIRNCIITGNSGGSQLTTCSTPSYSCIGLWTGGGIGNLPHFPYFVDAARGDYHVKTCSPCIDAGDPDSLFSEEPKPNGGRINMGAYGNTLEATCGSPDNDRDSMPDDWEFEFFGSLTQDADEDPDGDLLSNIEEYRRGLDPTSPAVIWYVDASVGSSGHGTSWESAFRTIQEGLDAATDGDRVVVAMGVYLENIDFDGKNIALQSMDPFDPVVRAGTVIEGSNGGSVVTFNGNETETCEIAGFTIANGTATYGGGIRGQGTGATIHNNVIAFNVAEWFGGGLSGCYGTIEDNTISNNYAFEGGGLAYCGGIIRRNVITVNITETSGGGLYSCTGTFEDNTISGNTSLNGAGFAYCDGTIHYNEIVDNVADRCGGGLYNCSGILSNNVLCGNAAGADGGGVSHFIGTIQNNTIVRNAAPYGGALSNCYAATVNCIIWDNSGRSQIYLSDSPTYSCIQNWTGDGEGNIAFHPYFVDADNRGFHLQSWSPCIDAGDPTSSYSLEPIPNGGRVNMGAYGNTPEATSKSLDADADELPDGWEMYWFGHLAQDTYGDPDGDLIPNLTEYFFGWHPGIPAETVVANVTQSQWYATIQAALFAADHGDEIVAYPGVYPENVNFGGKNVTLRSTDPSDPEVIAETIIDGGQKSSAVAFSGTEDESCVLAGFTIRNGKADCGGAICGGRYELPTRAVIESNVITGNSAVRGGGLALCDGTVRHNTITGNSADEEGGGLYACTGAVERNSVYENTASKGGGVASCHGLIRNNVIILNTAVENGGGLYGCDGTVENNTVFRNVASDGGGLHTCNGTLRNNIVWGNHAETQIAESSQPTYSCIEDWSGGGEGNFSYYPYFLDAPSGDYRLNIWSPCIDAGNPTSPFSEEPDPNGSRVNMGAYGNTSDAASGSLDIDEDGLPDQWELEFFETLLYGPGDDPEGDFISNLEEYRDGTDPSAMPGWHVDASVPVSGDGTSWDRAFKTIQEGIDAADPEDTVFVAQGTYVENIRFHGKNITLSSMNPLDPVVVSETIIDGNASGPVVTFDGTENETCLLAGFTITGGRSEYGAGICGRVPDLYTHATIRNNVIVANTATSHGGGLAFCWGTIQNNTISGNMAGSLGGGLSECDGDILDNQILDNSAVSNGGGLCECDGTILHNVITGNVAGEFGGGLYYCDFRIDGNVIAGNSAGREGGGLSSSRGTIRNNLIYVNVAQLGGGLSDCQGTVENNTVTANTADGGGGLYICSGTISTCIVWGNMAPDGPELRDCSTPEYSCIRYGQDDGVGNTSDYPYFVAPSSDDYHLLSWSPCIDAGDPSSQFSNEPDPNGGRINMGAYGDTPEATSASEDTDLDFLPDNWEMSYFGHLGEEYSGDPDLDGRSNYLEYRHGTDPNWNGRWYIDGSVRESGDGLSRETAFKTIQEGINASSDWEEVIVAEGVYSENIHFHGKSITLTSIMPSDPAVVANTLIDGGRSGPVVTFFGFENETCVLSGFTIQNGSADSGGGISGNGSHAAIQNNVIKGNMASTGGGLAHCHGSIYDNGIHGNWANMNGGGFHRCDGEIYGNVVYENGAERNGGGLYVCAGAILNNVIYGNQAGNNGGGLCACNGSVENNTVFDNFAVGSGGGLCDCNGIIRNCILWGNTAQDGFQLFGGETPTYCCIEGWHDAGDGNISYYPYFVDYRAADFHLTRWSPCIDAGDLSSDFSREPLSMIGRINLGAYGNTPEAASAGWDFDGDGLPDDWENHFFGDLTQGPSDDTDGDGRTNLQEYHRGSDPTGFGTWYVDISVSSSGDGTSWETALKTIQEGIDAAFDGDVVLVAEGTYFENIHFRGKNIALTSTDPLSENVVAKTTIDGGANGSVVTLAGTEDETCRLSGFTIRNGSAQNGGGICGGTQDNCTQAVIENNVITSNSAATNGGALAYCNGTIRKNSIADNSADNGGALAYSGGTVQANDFHHNRARYYGGAAYECSAVFRNNILYTNSAGEAGGGMADCSNTIENNVIAGNSAGESGGGLCYCEGTIRNCIIWGNSPLSFPQVRESKEPTFSCISASQGEGEGNISFYPYFVDRESGDYHLQPWSPCIDAGDPSSDFSNEPQPNGGRVNMGAYGNTSEATSASADIDKDMLPDEWEMLFFEDLSQDPSDDPDGDGRSNLQEYRHGSDPTFCVTWYVDGSVTSSGDGASWATAFKTIQAGINAAAESEIVLVGEGTYVENIRFCGINIVLTSTDPLDPAVVANTIIDGHARDSVVTFTGGEDETCLLSGFTIQNGDAYHGGGILGLGVWDNRTRATIQNNTITDNSARFGGGLAFCDGTILNNTITENSATGSTSSYGGGLAYCRGLIQSNVVTGNLARFGGGLAHCDGTILNNTIADNSSEGDGGGLDWCDATIWSNVISGNSAVYAGGALGLCHGTIRNNAIFNNSAQWGGGLANCDGTILNNTICGNSAWESGGALWDCDGTVMNCVIWGNMDVRGAQLSECVAPTYSCIQRWHGGGEGNITFFPYFVDPESGDLHLQPWSPCIDAGDPSSDFSNEPQPNGGRINMGAYGNTPEATSASPDADGDLLPDDWEVQFFGDLAQRASDDPDGDGRSNIEEYQRGTNPAVLVTWYVDGAVASPGDGTSWETAFKTIQEGIDAAFDGDVVLVAEGTYFENIRFRGKNIALTSTDPLNEAVVSETIIDGGGNGSVVTFAGTEDETCALSGFTIQNGAADWGGGIAGNSTHAKVQNNLITGNFSAGDGGALCDCDGTIQSNTISGNSAGDDGGGLGFCDGVIQNNVITGNSAHDVGGGLDYCRGEISNNTVSGNSADDDGGGIARCDGLIENNTITDNWAASNGGGLYNCGGIIQNCIIWRNTAAGGSQSYDSVTPTYSCIQGWREEGEGNISAFPYFVDPEAGDYHLQTWSPCIDAADPSSDFSNEPQPNGGRINMGAYGNTPEATSASPDADGDLLPDDWEVHFFGDLAQGASDDPDGDGRSNIEEYRRGTNPAVLVTWYVDGSVSSSGGGTSWETAFKTIQEGIGAASDDDAVLVAEGIYLENIHFNGKNIALTSTDPLNEAVVSETIIDGGANSSVVTFAGTEDETCALSGFTIQNGDAERGGGICGGTQDSRTEAVVENNVITSNFAATTGGGLAYCNGTIRNNTISANDVATDSPDVEVRLPGASGGAEPKPDDPRTLGTKDGGGLAYCNGSIENNTISHNIAANDGGGLAHCHGLIENNTISENSSLDNGGGLAYCNGIIRNNAIADNSGDNGAGVAYCDGTIQANGFHLNKARYYGGAANACNAVFLNNIISTNSAGNGGGGMAQCWNTIENNVIADNSAGESGGGLYDCNGTIRNCIIWRNSAPYLSQMQDCSNPTYSSISGWRGGGEGNISFYPHFVDPDAGDYHLQPWSPCVDAGDPSSDFSNEPQPDGGRINMGAYGNTSEATSASADIDGDQLPDDWEVHFFGDLAQGASDDPDGDGRSNIEEYRRGTNPAVLVTWYVDGSVSSSGGGTSWETAFKTIQEGIDTAADGDIALVAEGTYFENIHFRGKNIALTSTDPLNHTVVSSTIIDGGGNGSVVTFAATEDETCALSGFTIQNGDADWGGGIAGNSTHAKVQNNLITGNFSAGDGGALCDCDGTIQSNTISGNSAGDDGGGLGFCDGVIQNNVITGNSAHDLGGGLDYCHGEISNNTVSGNSADDDGGGLARCDGMIENNTITDNWAASNGGGLYNCGGIIQNCIIWRNTAAGGSQSYDSVTPTYSCIQGWREEGEGNISAFPYFVDPEAGDYHLQTWSPCIDAADPSSDFSNEPHPNGGRINMGAYGNTPEATSASEDTDEDLLPDEWEVQFFGDLAQGASDDPDGDGRSNIEEYQRGTNPAVLVTWYVDGSVTSSGDGTSWETAFKRIQEGIDAAFDGDIVVVAEETYVENIHFRGKNITLTSLNPHDPTVVANTVIDGGELMSVVTFAGTEDETCVLTGFTVQNGSAEDGGGIAGGGTHATVERNVITGNSSASNGGGLAYCDGTIESNVISANSASNRGGGLHYCHGTVQSNTISENSAENDGGGLYACDGIIQNNTMTGNSSEDDGGSVAFCDGTIQNNIISGNLAQDYGGGLAHSSGIIRNNLILDNLAGYKGGGLYDCNGAIENNTIFGNSAPYGGDVLGDCKGTIRNCIIWGNEGSVAISNSSLPTYSCIERWGGGGEGNIAFVPRFVDPENGDYHLRSWSPCVDAGDPSSEFLNEPQPNGGRINMGAYGNTPEAAFASEDSDADLLPDDWETLWFGDLGQSSSDDPDDDLKTNLQEYRYGTDPAFSRKWFVDASVLLSGDGSSWDTAFKTIQQGIDAASDGDTVIVAEGIHFENIQFPSTHPVWETIFEENFDTFTELYTPDDVLNTGWTVLSGCGFPEGMWRLWSTTGDMLGFEDPAIEGMSGNYMITDSDLAGDSDVDEELITPEIDCSNWVNVHLGFNKNYRVYTDDIARLQIADVDIRVHDQLAGWGQWINLLRSDSTTVAEYDTGREQVDISAYADSNRIQIRWRYYEANFDWWFAVDEIRVFGELAGVRPLAQNSQLDANAKNITLRSKDPSDSSIVDSTIIDGGQRHSVVTFSGDESEATVLAGFTIRNGSAVNGGGICGLTMGDPTRATIRNNVITGNLSESDGGGVAYCDGPIVNNLISHNSSGDDGGGLFDCNGTIENNTIVNNSAYDLGGALAACAAPMRNCIIWGNAAARYPQFFDEHRATYCCIQNWNDGGEGNISFSPYFVDPAAGDYHLQSWSPCIDSGDPSSDFSNEPQPNGERINMGAYGNTPEAAGASPDSDSDLLPDDWEMHFFGVLTFGASDDVDGDGRSNLQEYRYGTDPLNFIIWYVDGSVKSSGDGKTWETAFRTIQEGIDAAGDGDVVIVAEGTYLENILFHGKNIALTSMNPTNLDIVANTIIDGGGKGPVVTFTGTEDEVCCLTGFTITKGDASYGGGIRGGDFDVHTYATIEQNVVTGNSAVDGAGVFGCDGIIQDNTISGNSATRGGGLYGCEGMITDNVISNNSAEQDGGGLLYCDGTIQGNSISDNSAGSDGGALSHCQGLIQSNVITGNAAYLGGGLAYCDGTIRNNVIFDNSAGGAFYDCDGAIENNTIYGNAAVYGGAFFKCDATIRNCIIWGNLGIPQLFESSLPTYSCIQHWNSNGEGNIAHYPYFVGTSEGDFHLQHWSPCVDAGDPASSFSEEPEPNGNRVNIGAYGNTPEAASPSLDSDHDGLPDAWEMEFFENLSRGPMDDPDADSFSNLEEYHRGSDPTATHTGKWYVDASVSASGDGTSWEMAFNTIQEGIDAASEGDVVAVAEGTYTENIHFLGENITLTSTDPLDPAVVANTVIDGGKNDSVVIFLGIEEETCMLSGFTIRNGSSERGGGIRGGWQGAQTRATIHNNIVLGNWAERGGGIAYCDGIIRDNGIEENSGEYCGGLYGCDGVIENNRVTANISQHYGGGLAFCSGPIANNLIAGNSAGSSGGGLYECDGIIRSNDITTNSATMAGGGLYQCDGMIEGSLIAQNQANKYGGGLAYCQGTVQNNVIVRNSAGDKGGGFYNCQGAIHNNTIASNSAGNEGGGLSGCDGTIVNNLIAGNGADDDGGGLYLCNGLIENNTICGNSADRGGGVYGCAGSIQNCIIWWNAATYYSQLGESSVPTFSCIQDYDGGGQGNITGYPLFIDPEGPDNDPSTFEDNNYRLAPASPCIDVGENQEWMATALDLDGKPRISRGHSSFTVDMGAYEFPWSILMVSETPNGEIQLTWQSIPGERYLIWSCRDLIAESWVKAATVSAEQAITTWSDPETPDARRFYRVEMEQSQSLP